MRTNITCRASMEVWKKTKIMMKTKTKVVMAAGKLLCRDIPAVDLAVWAANKATVWARWVMCNLMKMIINMGVKAEAAV